MPFPAVRATRLGHIEPRLADAVLALGLTVWALVAFADNPVGSVLPLLAVTLPLAWRRRFPLATFCIVGCGLAALIYEPDSGARAFGPIALSALLLGTFTVVTHASRRYLAAGAVAVVAALAAARAQQPTLPLPSWLVPLLLLGGTWLASQALRARSERAERLAEDARRLQREQQLERQLTLRVERERIARELHDIVTHGVSLMVLQSAAARRLHADGEEQTELLLGIEDSGRQALAELRRMLDLLDAEGDAPLAPQPGTRQLSEMIGRVRDTGLPVELYVEGDPRALTPAVELSVYRIVQEALTNSLTHGARAGTRVVLRYEPCELQVEVLDATVTPNTSVRSRAGRGLLGIQERVAIHSGTLTVGPDDQGGFAVRLRLPLNRASHDHAADRG